jgi:adenylyltransferase/sulfurtransferase
MSVTVQVPSTLRAWCGDATAEFTLSAATVRAALEELEQSRPILYRSICDETGTVRPHVNLFINNSFIREREGLDTVLEPGDVLTIMPAVSGG